MGTWAFCNTGEESSVHSVSPSKGNSARAECGLMRSAATLEASAVNFGFLAPCMR